MKTSEIPDEEFLTMSNGGLARKYGFSRNGIWQARKKRGLKNPFRYGYNAKERRRLAQENAGKSVVEISEILGLFPTQVSKYLRTQEISHKDGRSWRKGRPSSHRKYPYHEIDWSTITTKELSRKWGIPSRQAATIRSRVKQGKLGVETQQ
jgi:hypothetical protein